MIGQRDNLKPDIVALLDEAEQRTRDNDKLDLIVAFNYGARQEIVEAARALARDAAAGQARSPRTSTKRCSPPQLADGRHARSRPHHPHLRRNAAVEFPDVAGRL